MEMAPGVGLQGTKSGSVTCEPSRLKHWAAERRGRSHRPATAYKTDVAIMAAVAGRRWRQQQR